MKPALVEPFLEDRWLRTKARAFPALLIPRPLMATSRNEVLSEPPVSGDSGGSA
jgi:hypothetical protein